MSKDEVFLAFQAIIQQELNDVILLSAFGLQLNPGAVNENTPGDTFTIVCRQSFYCMVLRSSS